MELSTIRQDALGAQLDGPLEEVACENQILLVAVQVEDLTLQRNQLSIDKVLKQLAEVDQLAID